MKYLLILSLLMGGCITNQEQSDSWSVNRKKRNESSVINLIGWWSLTAYSDIEVYITSHTANQIHQDTVIGTLTIDAELHSYPYTYVEDTLFVQTEYILDKLVRPENVK